MEISEKDFTSMDMWSWIYLDSEWLNWPLVLGCSVRSGWSPSWHFKTSGTRERKDDAFVVTSSLAWLGYLQPCK